jgi:hypothetical protein
MSKQSQVAPAEYTVDIDFDEASEGWMANKRKLANGMYRYICGFQKTDGKKCMRAPAANQSGCWYHSRAPAKKKVAASSSIIDMHSILTHTRLMLLKGQALSKKFSSVADPDIPTVLNMKEETIRIPSMPALKRTFNEFRYLMDSLGETNVISSMENIQSGRRRLDEVLLCYLLAWSFLEGMKQMTKMDTKHPSIVRIQTRLLAFYGYTGLGVAHLTLSQWTNITEEIQEHTKKILRELSE